MNDNTYGWTMFALGLISGIMLGLITVMVTLLV